MLILLGQLLTFNWCIVCCTLAAKKAEENKRARELGQLRREARHRQHQINSLQSDAKRRENVLKRRQEEVGVVSGCG